MKFKSLIIRLQLTMFMLNLHQIHIKNDESFGKDILDKPMTLSLPSLLISYNL